MNAIGDYDGNALVQFAQDVHDIVFQYSAFRNEWDIPRVVGTLWQTGDLAKFFDWMNNIGNPGGRTVRDRLEQGYGTIHVAGNLVRNGWSYIGLALDTTNIYPYNDLHGEWWGGLALLQKSVAGRTILTLERGDHCAQCANKAQEIGDWVARALTRLPIYQSRFPGSIGVISVAFTREGAQGVIAVIQSLQSRFSNADAAIIVSWVDSHGHIWWVCIGRQCSGVVQSGEGQQIACNEHGQAAGCSATYWTGQPIDFDDQSSGDPINLNPAITPNPKISYNYNRGDSYALGIIARSSDSGCCRFDVPG
ncbi:hypothetical protein HYR54_02680 [Candidatus Acetothermia bacterium]|nr:hypothetical protein [Candidatus Acetothermia bacterium]